MSLARELVHTLHLREQVQQANGVKTLTDLMEVTFSELDQEELEWLMVNQFQQAIPYFLTYDLDQIVGLLFTRGVQFGRELERVTS